MLDEIDGKYRLKFEAATIESSLTPTDPSAYVELYALHLKAVEPLKMKDIPIEFVPFPIPWNPVVVVVLSESRDGKAHRCRHCRVRGR